MTESIKKQKVHIVIPFFIMLICVCVNIFYNLYMYCNGIILFHIENWILIIAITIYFYIKGMKIVDFLFIDKFKWKRPVFYLLYYTVMIFVYAFIFDYYLSFVESGRQFVFDAFGASITNAMYYYTNIMFFQIGVKFCRWLLLKIYASKMFKKVILDKFPKRKELSDEQIIKKLRDRNIDKRVIDRVEYLIENDKKKNMR